MQDNLLNTNPDFDYGAFRALANSVRHTTLTGCHRASDSGLWKALSASQGAFAFTFDVAGVYVFASSTRPDQVMIVRVVPENTLCPLGGRIAPLTTSNLVLLPHGSPSSALSVPQVALGIQRNPNVLLTPDWTLIGVLVGVGIVLFVSVLAGASHVSGSKWGGLRERAATYKATAAGNDVDVFNIGSKGSIVTKDTAAGALAEAGPVGPDDHVLAEVDPIDTVEQFDFQAIQRELQTHGEHVDKAMLTQTVDMHAFADRVLRDTDQLKSLLAIKLHDEVVACPLSWQWWWWRPFADSDRAGEMRQRRRLLVGRREARQRRAVGPTPLREATGAARRRHPANDCRRPERDSVPEGGNRCSQIRDRRG